MELSVAAVSLVWVIGVLTLQRLDTVDDDYSKAVAIYTATTNGKMNLEQLTINSVKPRSAVIKYLIFLITKSERKDKIGLKKFLKYFNASAKVEKSYLALLILITAVTPALYIIDFTDFFWTDNLTKDGILLALVIIFALCSVIAEKIMRIFSDRYYPISYEVK
jgi:hypothetical protein